MWGEGEMDDMHGRVDGQKTKKERRRQKGNVCISTATAYKYCSIAVTAHLYLA